MKSPFSPFRRPSRVLAGFGATTVVSALLATAPSASSAASVDPAGRHGWSPEQVAATAPRFDGPPADASVRGVGVDDAGRVTVLWMESSARFDQWRLLTATRSAAGQWSAPQVLMPRSAQPPNGAQIAVAGDGSAIAAWRQPRGILFANPVRVMAATMTPEGIWSAPQVLAEGSRRGLVLGDDSGTPQQGVGIGPGSRSYVVWTRRNEVSIAEIDGSTVVSTKVVSTPARAGSPIVSVSARGVATVFWWQARVGTPHRFRPLSRRKLPGAARWSSIERVSRQVDAGFFRASTSPSGVTTVAWLQSNGAQELVVVAQRGGNGVFKRVLSRPLGPAGGFHEYTLSVLESVGGRVLVGAYGFRPDTDQGFVSLLLRNRAGRWESPHRVPVQGTADLRAVLAPGGGVVAMWARPGNFSAQERNAHGQWGRQYAIGRSHHDLALDISPSGNLALGRTASLDRSPNFDEAVLARTRPAL